MNIPDYMHGQVQDILQSQQREAERKQLWAVVLGLKPFKDGDHFCVLLGEDLQSGIAAFGKTLEDAMWKFEAEFCKPATLSTKTGGAA